MPPLEQKDVHALIDTLESQGYRVSKVPPVERASAQLTLPVKSGGIVRVGVVSDTHFGSKLQQPTALRDFYAFADAKGCTAYLHGGDILEGIHQAHRDAAYEQYAHGVDAQVKAVVEQYPKSKNGPTYFIDGNHDDFAYQNVGVTSGAMIADKREDLKYLGYHSAFVTLNESVRFLVQHGARGGGSYAKSYKPQKLVEQLADSERAETQVALFGHWHTELYMGRYMGLFTFMLPCFQAQTRFLRTIGRNPTVAGLILELEFTRDRKIWNITPQFRYFEPRLGDYPGAASE